MYLYESHLGGYYISEDEIPYEDLYCETCGDSDQYLYSGTEEEIISQFYYDVDTALRNYNAVREAFEKKPLTLKELGELNEIS
mgnify:FL=1|jgi:hypothetical protein